MIYLYDEQYRQVAIPLSNVERIIKDETIIKTKSGEDREIDFYKVQLVSGRSLTSRSEPYLKKTIPLPSQIEVWSYFEDEQTKDVTWDIAKSAQGVYSLGVFTNRAHLEMAITDDNESVEDQHATLLVDRAGCRVRINTYDSAWSDNILGTMSELIGKQILFTDQNYLWENNSQLPKTKIA